MSDLRLGAAGVATFQDSGRNCMDLHYSSSLIVSKELSRDDASDSNSYNYNISFPRNNKKSENAYLWQHVRIYTILTAWPRLMWQLQRAVLFQPKRCAVSPKLD